MRIFDGDTEIECHSRGYDSGAQIEDAAHIAALVECKRQAHAPIAPPTGSRTQRRRVRCCSSNVTMPDRPDRPDRPDCLRLNTKVQNGPKVFTVTTDSNAIISSPTSFTGT